MSTNRTGTRLPLRSETDGLMICQLTYRIFSIKRPRPLFKTWFPGPGVYLKPAVNRGPAFINEVKVSSLFRLIYYFTFFETRAQFVKAGRFLPWTRPDIMSLYLIHTALHTALHTARVYCNQYLCKQNKTFKG